MSKISINHIILAIFFFAGPTSAVFANQIKATVLISPYAIAWSDDATGDGKRDLFSTMKFPTHDEYVVDNINAFKKYFTNVEVFSPSKKGHAIITTIYTTKVHSQDVGLGLCAEVILPTPQLLSRACVRAKTMPGMKLDPPPPAGIEKAMVEKLAKKVADKFGSEISTQGMSKEPRSFMYLYGKYPPVTMAVNIWGHYPPPGKNDTKESPVNFDQLYAADIDALTFNLLVNAIWTKYADEAALDLIENILTLEKDFVRIGQNKWDYLMVASMGYRDWGFFDGMDDKFEKNITILAKKYYKPSSWVTAAGYENVILLNALARHGNKEDINKVFGRWADGTALHVAIRYNDIITARWLLENGASLKIKNKSGMTPYDVAMQSDDRDMQALVSNQKYK